MQESTAGTIDIAIIPDTSRSGLAMLAAQTGAVLELPYHNKRLLRKK